MKYLAIFLPLILQLAVHADEGKSRVLPFNVSEVGADKSELMKIFTAVQIKDREDLFGIPQSYRIIQVIGKKEFLVQVLPAGKRILWLKTLNEISAADGEVIRDIYAVVSERTRSYTNIQGAKATVRIAEEIIPPPFMKQEAFVSLLKSGKTWTLPAFKSVSCQRCFGDGKLSVLQGSADCPDCDRKGSTSFDLLVTW
jgi:hypothetical protein